MKVVIIGLGAAGLGAVRRDLARHGLIQRNADWKQSVLRCGSATCSGGPWYGWAWLGNAWAAKQRTELSLRALCDAKASAAWPGTVGFGSAWLGMARFGMGWMSQRTGHHLVISAVKQPSRQGAENADDQTQTNWTVAAADA